MPGQNHKLQKPGPEAATAGTGPDNVSGTTSDLKVLLTFLGDRAGVPVVDETGLREILGMAAPRQSRPRR